MPIALDPVLSSRIKIAWAELSASQQQQILPLLEQAHRHLEAATQGVIPRSPDEVERALLFGITVLSDDADHLLGRLPVRAEAKVDGSGAIWGTGKYELLDPGWLEALAEWLEHLILGRHRFVAKPVELKMPDVVTIGLAGDWGTGDWRLASNPSPSARVGKQLADLRPYLDIHLGDVYYAGTRREETHLLSCLWPRGSMASAALNSNHEMYSGAKPYFKAIGKAPFQQQRGCSYFSYENQHWIVVGLDSAYFADELKLYRNGALFPVNNPNTFQMDFIKAQVPKGKGVIVLTHHNGLSLDGTFPTLLWGHVTAALKGAAGPVYWYWGHVHSGVVYQPRPVGDMTVKSRCCGHGGLAGGFASDLDNHEDTVQWFECRSADDHDIPDRILNGFTTVALDGPKIVETFYDEDGKVAWSSSLAVGSSATPSAT